MRRFWWLAVRRWRATPKIWVLRHSEETFEGIEMYRTRRAFYLCHVTYIGEQPQKLGGTVELLREHVFFVQKAAR